MLYLLYSRHKQGSDIDWNSNPTPQGATPDIEKAEKFVQDAGVDEHRYYIEGGYRG